MSVAPKGLSGSKHSPAIVAECSAAYRPDMPTYAIVFRIENGRTIEMKGNILPCILYVDDDLAAHEHVRILLREALKQFDLFCAKSAWEALGIIKDRTFDLYIFEYCMSQVTGAQLCNKIRSTDPRTPIIMCSTMFRDVDRETAIVSGANSYLIKPDEFDKLGSTVNRLLRPSPSLFRRRRPGRHASGII